MPKFIVRPEQRVTHGSEEDARAHFAKMQPGQTFGSYPPAPLVDYLEGDEIELTDEQAAKMPWAVCTPEEFEELCSPSAFVKKGYTRGEAEEKSEAMRKGIAERVEARKAKAARSSVPAPAKQLPAKTDDDKKSQK